MLPLVLTSLSVFVCWGPLHPCDSWAPPPVEPRLSERDGLAQNPWLIVIQQQSGPKHTAYWRSHKSDTYYVVFTVCWALA